MRAAIPSRKKAWSSTDRMRIKSGLAVMGFRDSLSQKPKSGSHRRVTISDRGGDAQLNLRAESRLRPDFHSSTQRLGPLAHAWQTPVAGSPALIENGWIDTRSVITDAQKKLRIPVGELRVYLAGLSVVECVAQCLTRDAVNLVAQNGIEIAPLTLNKHPEGRREVVLVRPEFLAESRQRLNHVGIDHRIAAQVFNCIASFGDHVVSAIEGAFERFNCFRCTPRKEIAHCLKTEHQPLETLQERIVELARDASTLGEAFFKTHIHLMRECNHA